MPRITLRHILPMLSLLLSASAGAQTITVQLLGGRDGKPVAKAAINVALGPPETQTIVSLTSNSQGEISFDTNGAAIFRVVPIRQANCVNLPAGTNSLTFSVADTIKTGLVTPNNCGHASSPLMPGRLIYFSRRATLSDLFH